MSENIGNSIKSSYSFREINTYTRVRMPCPFCGGKVKKHIAPIRGTVIFWCEKCGADVCFYGAEHEPKATEAWNRRTDNG